MEPKELMKLLAKDGWVIVRIQGSQNTRPSPEPYQ